jgi:hypothetical protein
MVHASEFVVALRKICIRTIFKSLVFVPALNILSLVQNSY